MNCNDCKNFNRYHAITWLMESKDCNLGIQREKENFIEYKKCDKFEQQSKLCLDECKNCGFRNIDDTCAIFEYPQNIYNEYNKCNRFEIFSIEEKIWNIGCYNICEDENCQCFIKSDDVREVCRFQKLCSNQKDMDTKVPEEIKLSTLEERYKTVSTL